MIQPNGFLNQIVFFYRELRKHDRTIIFHECCWPTLDLALAIARPSGLRVPIVTLASFVSLANISLAWNWFKSRRTHTPVTSQILQVVKMAILWPFFHFIYEGDVQAEGGGQLNLCAREWLHRTLKFSTVEQLGSALTSSQNLPRITPDLTDIPSYGATSSEILVVLAQEQISLLAVEKCYGKLFEKLAKLDYRIVVKQHPRSSEFIDWKPLLPTGSEYKFSGVEASIPAEILCEKLKIKVVIGIASTSLALSSVPSISLVDLVPFSPEQREMRRRHMLETKSANKKLSPIYFLDSWGELETFLERIVPEIER